MSGRTTPQFTQVNIDEPFTGTGWDEITDDIQATLDAAILVETTAREAQFIAATDDAQASADAALLAAQSVSDGIPHFATTSAAQASALPNGSDYTVPGNATTTYMILYRKDSSSASTLLTDTYSRTGMQATYTSTTPTNAALYAAGVFFDPDGLLGTVRGFYVPLTFRLERDGTNRSVTDIGPADSVMTTHRMIVIPTANQHWNVYLDLSTGAANDRLKAGTLAAGLPPHDVNYVKICNLIGRRIFDNRMNVRLVAEDGLAHPKSSIVVEKGGKVYLPGVFASNGDYSINDGAFSTLFYEQLQLPILNTDLAEPLWVVRNRVTNTNQIIQQRPMPKEPNFGMLLYRYQGMFGGPYELLGPEIAGGCTPNLSVCGQNDPELATNVLKRDTLAEFVDVTDTDAVALGFTRGLRNNQTDPLVAGKMWYGNSVVQARPGDSVFGRITVLTDTDNNFGSPRILMWDENRNGFTGSIIALKLFKQHSPKLATFAGWGTVPANAKPYEITLGTLGDAAVDYTIMGAGFGVSPTKLWVAEADWGGVNRPIEAAQMLGRATGLTPFLLGDRLDMIRERPFTMYPTSFLDIRSRGNDAICRLARLAPMDGRLPFETEGGQILKIDPSLLETGDTIELSALALTRGDDGQREQLFLTTTVTEPVSIMGKTIKLLTIGDSIMALAGVGQQATRILNRYDCTLQGIGTTTAVERLTQNPTPVSGDELICEARGGWRSRDVVGAFDTADDRTPVTDPVAYLALTNNGRLQQNPMVRPLTGSESMFVKKHAYKENPTTGDEALRFWDEEQAGHSPDPSEYFTFDLAYYQTTYGIETPDVVLYLLGANELNDYPGGVSHVDPIAAVKESYEILLTNVRETWPDTIVLIAFANISSVSGMNERLALEDSSGNGRGQVAMLRNIIKIVRDWHDVHPSDVNMVRLISMWSWMNSHSMMYPWTSVPHTDLYGSTISTIEGLHPQIGPSREQAGEALAAALAPIVAAL